MSLTWAELREAWAAGWASMQENALATYGSSIAARPTDYAAIASATITNLRLSAANLGVIHGLMQAHPNVVADVDKADLTAMRHRYQDLGAGIYADAASFGAAPAVGVVLIVLGVGLTIAAIAWAIVAYPYTSNLRDETALKRQELEARIQASKDGRYVQPSTLTPDVPSIDLSSKGDGIGGGTIALGVAAALGLVGLVAWRR